MTDPNEVTSILSRPPESGPGPGRPSALRAAAPSGEATEPRLRDYLRILSYHWHLLLLVGVLPLAGAVAYTLSRSELYRARAVLVRSEGTRTRSGRGDADIELQMAAQVVNQAAVRAAAAGAEGDPFLNLVAAGLERSLAESRLGVQVPELPVLASTAAASIEGRSDKLTVTATIPGQPGLEGHEDNGRMAAIVARAFAGALMEHSDARWQEEVRKARGDIEAEIMAKSAELRDLVTKILKKRARLPADGSDPLPLPSEIEAVMGRTEHLRQAGQEARFREKELERTLAQLDESIGRQLRATAGRAGRELAELDVGDLKEELIKVEMALARAQIRYREAHPKLRKLLSEKEVLCARIRERSPAAAGSEHVNLGRLEAQRDIADAELHGVRARIRTVEEALAEEEASLERLMSEGVNREYADLIRKQQVLTASLTALQKQLEGVEGLAPRPLPQLRQLSAPTAPTAPYSPRWSVNLAVGLGLAMVLVLAAAFISENLEDRIRDQRDLTHHFNLPFLGPVPNWREGEPRLVDLERPRSVIADVFGVLRNNIGYALPPGAPKVLLVASSVVGEGKSTIAANLAISYCLDGNNVLLVDTDLRRPRAHRLLESLCPQVAGSPGLTGYLSDRAGLEDILFRASVPGLSIIGAGRGAVNPSKLLGSPRMRELIGEVTRSFDAVILDGPAVLPVVDSTVVSALATGVLLVVASKRAPAEQISTAVARLEHVKAPLVGMILNRQPGGSGGYYHYYGSRYGYGAGYYD
jgi:capsular exopolysaccharide synthesis family protein